MLPVSFGLDFSDSSQSPLEENLDRRGFESQLWTEDQRQSPPKQEPSSPLATSPPRGFACGFWPFDSTPTVYWEDAFLFIFPHSPSTNISSSILSSEAHTQATFQAVPTQGTQHSLRANITGSDPDHCGLNPAAVTFWLCHPRQGGYLRLREAHFLISEMEWYC